MHESTIVEVAMMLKMSKKKNNKISTIQAEDWNLKKQNTKSDVINAKCMWLQIRYKRIM